MRKLFDTIETHACSLNCLGYNCHSYEPMLIPILLSELPQELNLKISKRFGKNVWDIKLIIYILRPEIEARETIFWLMIQILVRGEVFWVLFCL